MPPSTLLEISDMKPSNQIKDKSKWRKRSERDRYQCPFLGNKQRVFGTLQHLLLTGSSMQERFKTAGDDLNLGVRASHLQRRSRRRHNPPCTLSHKSRPTPSSQDTKEEVEIVIVNNGSNDLNSGRSLTTAQPYKFTQRAKSSHLPSSRIRFRLQ
ncbi:hypothetical protein DSL72_000155 [Monilinia vaccinii-corymbosi]|uniref:Uncharacterized protein n=1 Tax=Monilinia vaccinii-corymbosi TaxID=61207 RepID=A0A8A3P891_9HELO|nr:hypothetical protein DSL72_000155 [Monilinia vaccinii-corymbosi]